MNGPAIPDFSERLERLERQNRRLRWVGGCVLVAMSTALWASQATSRTTILEAERVTIKDKHGRVRAMLGLGVVLAEGEDSVGVRLLGSDGKTRAQMLLRGADDAPFVQLRDREEKVSAQLDIASDGTPGLGLWGPRAGFGAPRAEIRMSFKDANTPAIALRAKDDTVLWKAP